MNKFIAIGLLLALVSCSSSMDVRPGVDGIHSISTIGGNVKDTESDAYKQARSFCHDKNQSVEFLSDESFKATPSEKEVDKKIFKLNESVATDVKFKCIDK